MNLVPIIAKSIALHNHTRLLIIHSLVDEVISSFQFNRALDFFQFGAIFNKAAKNNFV